MANVSPFRGIHYDTAAVGPLEKVVSQPYDVISPEEQKALHARHPNNIVRVDFGLDEPGDGPGNSKYTRAAARMKEWLEKRVLVRDDLPSLYYYEQEFSIPDLGRFVRKGFLGALRLSAFGEGEVYPHEKTLSKPKQDRLALMRATEANTSPIFGVFSDPADDVLKALRAGMGKTPDLAATDDLGVAHRVWRVSSPAALSAAVGAMADKKVFIADGHHRYETGLAFRDEMRAKHGVRPGAAYDHLLMFLCNMNDEGIVILPTHRGIHSVPGFAEEAFAAKIREHLPVETRAGSPEDARKAVAEAGAAGKAIAWSAGGERFHIVNFPDVARFADARLSSFPKALRALDVVLLHGFLLGELLGISAEDVTAGKFVKYYKDPAKAKEDLSSGAVQAAFFLNPVTMEEFRDVSLSGNVLPQKSTFFYPKILTGLLVFPVGRDERVPG